MEVWTKKKSFTKKRGKKSVRKVWTLNSEQSFCWSLGSNSHPAYVKKNKLICWDLLAKVKQILIKRKPREEEDLKDFLPFSQETTLVISYFFAFPKAEGIFFLSDFLWAVSLMQTSLHICLWRWATSSLQCLIRDLKNLSVPQHGF